MSTTNNCMRESTTTTCEQKSTTIVTTQMDSTCMKVRTKKGMRIEKEEMRAKVRIENESKRRK